MKYIINAYIKYKLFWPIGHIKCLLQSWQLSCHNMEHRHAEHQLLATAMGILCSDKAVISS